MKLIYKKLVRWADSLPVWVIVLLDCVLGIVVFFDVALPDPLPVLDEALTTGILVWSTQYLWFRLFRGADNERTLEIKGRVRDIGELVTKIRSIGKVVGSRELRKKVRRLSVVKPLARDLAHSLIVIEDILTRPDYEEGYLENVLSKLEVDVLGAQGAAKDEIAAALDYARLHLKDLTILRAKGEELRGSLERIRQLCRRVESLLTVSAMDASADLSDLDDLFGDLEEMITSAESSRHEVAHAAVEISTTDRVIEARLKEVKLLPK